MNSELLLLKDTIQIMKTQARDSEKIFADHISEKILVSRMHEELNNKTTTKLKRNKQKICSDTSQMKIYRQLRISTSLVFRKT